MSKRVIANPGSRVKHTIRPFCIARFAFIGCNKAMQNYKVAIVLPNRLGDSILSLPAILALFQLYQNLGVANTAVTLYGPKPFVPFLKALNLFACKPLTWGAKVQSWHKPYDKVFYFATAASNVGLRSLQSFGEPLAHKWYCRYTHPLPALCLDGTVNHMDPGLLAGLQKQYHLSLAACRYFDILKPLGFSVEAVLSNLDLAALHLNVIDAPESFAGRLEKKYVVFCMEAGYGSHRASGRRMAQDVYFDVAIRIRQNFGLSVVFLGLEIHPALPQNTGFVDLRGQLSVMQAASVIRHAVAYIGNDSGLLHLASLAGKPSIALYSATHPEVYGPIRARLNRPVYKPVCADDIWPSMDEILKNEQSSPVVGAF